MKEANGSRGVWADVPTGQQKGHLCGKLCIAVRGHWDLEGREQRQVKRRQAGPGRVALLVGASTRTPKGCGFNSWSRYMPRVWVRSLLGQIQEATDWWMFLSHIDVSFSVSEINIHISPSILR